MRAPTRGAPVPARLSVVTPAPGCDRAGGGRGAGLDAGAGRRPSGPAAPRRALRPDGAPVAHAPHERRTRHERLGPACSRAAGRSRRRTVTDTTVLEGPTHGENAPAAAKRCDKACASGAVRSTCRPRVGAGAAMPSRRWQGDVRSRFPPLACDARDRRAWCRAGGRTRSSRRGAFGRRQRPSGRRCPPSALVTVRGGALRRRMMHSRARVKAARYGRRSDGDEDVRSHRRQKTQALWQPARAGPPEAAGGAALRMASAGNWTASGDRRAPGSRGQWAAAAKRPSC
jgi:hypothetical protein